MAKRRPLLPSKGAPSSTAKSRLSAAPAFSQAPAKPAVYHQLTVTSDSPAAEIVIIGPDFEMKDRAVGRLVSSLPRGIYTARVRLGRDTRTETIFLSEDTVTDIGVVRSCAATVPIPGTAQSHPYQYAGAHAKSTTVDLSIGKKADAQILFVSRYWADKGDHDARASLKKCAPPAQGLRLYRGDDGASSGSVLAEFDGLGTTDRRRDPWSAAVIGLPTGAYEIGWATGKGDDEFRFSVIASRGWQTQVFIRRRTDGASKQFQARALQDISVSMVAIDRVREPWNEQEYLLGDAARVALARGQSLLSTEVEELLVRKFSDPMLGVLGLHLVLQARLLDKIWASRKSGVKPRPVERHVLKDTTYRPVIRRLRDLVGRDHPDVEALAMAFGMDDARPLSAVPMLRASWDIALTHGKTKASVVPYGLWRRTAMIADVLPFLTWKADRSPDDNLPAELVESLGAMLGAASAQRSATRRPMSRAAAPDARLERSTIAARAVAEALNIPLSAAPQVVRALQAQREARGSTGVRATGQGRRGRRGDEEAV